MYENTECKILESIDAETLMATAFYRRAFLVEELIPRGLTVLSGASKAGKSWMMLWMALQIASGQEIWGLKTNRCGVLYISLEDTMERLQERLFELTDAAPPNLRLCVRADLIGSGLEEQICNHLAMYPETGLVIIDTFQKIRNSRSTSTANIYATDYSDISAVKNIADEMCVSIILVHHLRKMKDGSDPFNDISGSTGIMGAADSCLILKRERGENTAKLLATGRDIEHQEFTLELESGKFIWKLKERKGAEKIKTEKVPDFLYKVADFMRHELCWDGSATELLEKVKEEQVNCRTVTTLLARYAQDFLMPKGITYETGRNNKGRYISLVCMPPDVYNPDGSYVS